MQKKHIIFFEMNVINQLEKYSKNSHCVNSSFIQKDKEKQRTEK